jgi:osomolarity two-component system, response regulator SSK1
MRPAAVPSANIRSEISVAIIYFTNIANYKLVRDLVQSFSERYSPTPSIPDVIAVPKPAGPRRFLTALFTAVNRPFVDPLFAPIATSPPSPSAQDLNPQSPFFGRGGRARDTASPPERRGSDRPVRSPRDHPSGPHPHPPSPLAVEIEAEGYFPETVRKLGTSPASGLLIQSPDGQPAGIFFQPKTKVVRNQNIIGGKQMERETTEAVRGSTRVSSLESTAPKLASFSLSTTQGAKESGGAATTSPPTDIYKFHLQQDQSTFEKSSDQGVKQVSPVRQASGGVLSPRRQKTSHDAHSETKFSPKRGKTSDNALVPPINVLIVEGSPAPHVTASSTI